MGLTTAGAIIASGLLSAGAGAVTAQKQRSSQKRLAAKGREQTENMNRLKRIKDKEAVDRERAGERTKSRLAAAVGRTVQGRQLGKRGIKARPTGSFADITSNVLDEGAGK